MAEKSSVTCGLNSQGKLSFPFEVGGLGRGYAGEMVPDPRKDILRHLAAIIADALRDEGAEARRQAEAETLAILKRMDVAHEKYFAAKWQLQAEARRQAPAPAPTRG
jgi:hypothetical protein